MRAHARAPYVFVPALPPATAGRHAKPGELPGEEAFDYRQPFEVDLGRAAVIAEVLRECGYRDCTAAVVTAELARPEHERGIIGRFAAGALERYGWRP
jgi:hypothetical protein